MGLLCTNHIPYGGGALCDLSPLKKSAESSKILYHLINLRSRSLCWNQTKRKKSILRNFLVRSSPPQSIKGRCRGQCLRQTFLSRELLGPVIRVLGFWTSRGSSPTPFAVFGFTCGLWNFEIFLITVSRGFSYSWKNYACSYIFSHSFVSFPKFLPNCSIKLILILILLLSVKSKRWLPYELCI